MHNDGFIYQLLDFFNAVYIYHLFLDYINFLYGRHLHLNLNYLLDMPWHFNYLFDYFFDRHHLLNDHFNDVGDFDGLVDNLAGIAIFDNLYWFLNNDFYNLRHFNYLFNDLFFENGHFNHLALFSFDSYNLFLDNFYFFDLSDSMIDNLFNNHWPFNFHEFFYNNFDLHYLRYFDDALDDFLHDTRYFHNLLGVLRYFNYLFNNVVNDFYHVYWYMNDLLYFDHLDNLNWFFDYLFNGDDLGHLYHTLNYLFNDLFNLNDLRNDSEHF